MAVNKTKAEALKYIKSLEGKGWDFDGYYGWQCYDLANMYWNFLTGGTLVGSSAKNIHTDNASTFKGKAEVIKNTASFVAQPGDLVIFNGNYGQGYGHVGIVTNGNYDGKVMQFVSLDQNWYGGGLGKTEVAQKIVHNYDFPMHFVRPLYKNESTKKKKKTTAKKETVKKETAKKTTAKKAVKKRKIMLVAGHGTVDPGAVANGTNERDFIRKNITKRVKAYLEKAGHEVALYGGSSQNQNMFADTAYGQNVGNRKDYGLYWVKNQGYEIVVEFHLDAASPSASGGHTIIASNVKADSIDKNIQNAIQKHVGTIRGITGRGNLLNCNVSKEVNINYRLVELGFITSKKDMNNIEKNLDAYCKDIAEAISGGAIEGGVSKPKSTSSKAKPTQAKTSSSTSGWSKNQHGTYWKKENSTFKCTAPQGIITRVGSPFLKAPKAGVLLKGQSVNYREIAIQDGYVWINWVANSGQSIWMPVRTAKGTPPNHSVGSAWGVFS